MPKKVTELTALDVKRMSKPGRHAVGGVPGLLLNIKYDTGAKSWLLRSVVGNKRRCLGLGGYPEISLAQARERARAAREQIRQGIDPIEERQVQKQALLKSQNGRMSFAAAAVMCHEKKIPEFRNEKHKNDWIRSIEMYVNPVIGKMAVADVELSHILKIFEPIWQTKTETATRLRQRVEQVLTWATVAGYRSGENPARWKGHLDAILPKPSKIHKKKHYPALPYKDMGPFMVELRKREAMAARALEFIILTAARSGETRLATWGEIDLDGRVWTVPAERMKAQKEHKVPLPDDAVKMLRALPRFQGSNYVFPAARGGPLSDMSISMLCRRMKIPAVPHGFRSTFRDWAAENTSFPREVCEQALAHTIGNAVEAAYRRGDLFEKRRRLMEAWNGYCNTVQKQATVTPLRKERVSNER